MSDLPSHTSVQLPALSPTMEKGNLKSWEKAEGDRLEEGDLLASIETDKATMDFETPEEGYLAKILVPAGSKDVPLSAIVCIIVENEDDIAAFKDYSPGESTSNAASAPASSIESPPSAAAAPVAAAAPPASGNNYPNHRVVNLPALSPTASTSNVKQWLKKEGDMIEEGDVIADVETDKATIDWSYEDPDTVFMAKHLVQDGARDVPVGQPVCVFVEAKDDVSAFANFQIAAQSAEAAATSSPPASAPSPAPTQVGSSAPATSSAPRAATTPGGRVIASPYARKLAMDKGIDLNAVTGSGPGGRVIAVDVERFTPSDAPAAAPSAKKGKAAAAAAGLPGQSIDIPLSNIRMVIAKRLLESKQTIPHYYLTNEIEMGALLKMRQQFNEQLLAEKIKLSVNDFVIKATALACRKVPECNSSWMDTFIRQYNTVDVSVAVSTDSGLITPIVANADTKGLVEISRNINDLASRARENRLKPEEFQGGTVTVSNLGMFGIGSFSAIINPPQACILAVSAAQERLVPDSSRSEGFRVASVMSVTLSCDHRVVDGAVGAQWMAHFRKLLEKPPTMLL